MRLRSVLLAASAGVALALGSVSASAIASTVPNEGSSSAWVGELNGRVVNDYKAPPNTRVVCSPNNPLAGRGELLAASSNVPQQLGLAANVIDIFCRDVRINTIVVRHFCTVMKA